MPVLCECISVIIKCSSIERFFKGGMDAFYKIIPNDTARSDGELFGVGFMNPMDVQSFIETLETGGLQFLQTNKLTIKRSEKGGLQIKETEAPSQPSAAQLPESQPLCRAAGAISGVVSSRAVADPAQ